MLQPVGKRVLVSVKDDSETSGQKPILLVAKPAKPTVFVVLAVGDEITKVNVSDTIYIGQYSTVSIEYEGREALLVHEDSIIAKVTPHG